MSPEQLTAEQRATIQELQAELKDLNLQADIAWAKYIHTKDEDCYDEVLRLEGEVEMKGLIAYIPKAGERKISKIRKLLAKVQGKEGEDCDGCDLGINEVRLGALESVNAWREDYNLPPLARLPQGVPGNAEECTLARAFQMSMNELGVEVGQIDVSSGDEITLEGHKNGEYWSDSPELGEVASQLIRDFDADAWLDLLTDNSLEQYADRLAQDEELERLQDVSDEFARRELKYSVYEIDLGSDAESVQSQMS